MSRHRSFCFTINNYTNEHIDILLYMSFKYMIFGFEKGTEKLTEHIQGYVQFDNPRSWDAVVNTLPYAAHVEVAGGNPKQNIDYCSKENEFYEFGDRPTEGGRLTYEQIKNAMNDPHNNPTIIRQYGKTYEQIKQMDIEQRKTQTKFYVINPVQDAITEINEYFEDEMDEGTVVITDLCQLGGYDDPKVIIYYQDYPEKLTILYPRGVPIKYKYGYEYKTVKPERFIVVTDTPKIYPLYKNIS